MTLVFHQTENVDKEKEFNKKNDVQTPKLKITITEMKIWWGGTVADFIAKIKN